MRVAFITRMRKTLFTALVLTFSAPVAAFADKAPTVETKKMSAPKDDATFASHMAEHHRQGIAMIDAYLARGTSDDVKTMARRMKTSQQSDLASLDSHKGNTTPMPKDPDMERGMTKLKAAKGAEADRLFLDMMIAHHASALAMTQSAKDKLGDAELKTMADKMFAEQARDIGEMQKLRESTTSARR